MLPIKCYSDVYIKDEDMGGTCSRHVWEMTNSQITMAGNPQDRNILGDVVLGGRIILKWVLEETGVRVWG
jgi:hypothetical protein